jgi:hypothetical protein
MVWGQWPFLPLINLQLPVWPIVVILIQLLYFYWVIQSLLQVLRVETIKQGWKLYWQAVIYLLPLFGPLIWLFSVHNPRRLSVSSFWGKRFRSDRS